MMKTKYIKPILLILIVLAVVVHTQPTAGQRAKNGQPNRQQNSKSDMTRSNQNQNNRKQRDNKAAQRMQQAQRLKKDEKAKMQKAQIQKQSIQNQTKENKNQKNLTNKNNQTVLTTDLTEVESDNQDGTNLIKINLQSQEEIHLKADSKRESLIKLMFLIVLGLIVIVLILLLKPCLSRTKAQPIQTQNTENPMTNNKNPSFNFQTFGQNDSHIQRIIIKQKETKIEIIKDRFLNKQAEQGVNVVTMTAPQQEQPKVSTPTFAQGPARKQM